MRNGQLKLVAFVVDPKSAQTVNPSLRSGCLGRGRGNFQIFHVIRVI